MGAGGGGGHLVVLTACDPIGCDMNTCVRMGVTMHVVPGRRGTNCVSSIENDSRQDISDRCISGRCSTKVCCRVYFTRGFSHSILRTVEAMDRTLVTFVIGCGAVFLQFANPPNIMATFNRTAIRAVAAVMSTELRALYNVGLARGLHCWGPILDLARDPRQGRNGESGSESPFLTSVFATEHTLGFQNGSLDAGATAPFFIGMSTLKHWGFNTVEDSDGSYRSSFNNDASNFTLQDAHLAPYRAAITKGGARGVMCSCR